jgi:hypothetical protein
MLTIINQMNYYFCLLLVSSFLFSCTPSEKLDLPTSVLQQELEIKRFDKELLEADVYDLANLNSKWVKEYGILYESFVNQMINSGKPQDPMITYRLEKFLTDSTILTIKERLEAVFSDFDQYEKELNQSFSYYSYYYPNTQLPLIVTFYSNFNAKSFPYNDTLGIGLDMFIGRDEAIVSYLASDIYPQYLKQDMDPQYLVTETLKSWIYANHSLPQEYINSTLYGSREDFLSTLVYHGKMMLLLEAITPEKSSENRFAFDSNELKWCEKNEKFIFQNIIEFELLYSTNMKEIKAYINPGNFTPGLPQQSPGGIGKWIGYKMVKNYFEEKEISLQDFIKNNDDAREILSLYRP